MLFSALFRMLTGRKPALLSKRAHGPIKSGLESTEQVTGLETRHLRAMGPMYYGQQALCRSRAMGPMARSTVHPALGPILVSTVVQWANRPLYYRPARQYPHDCIAAYCGARTGKGLRPLERP